MGIAQEAFRGDTAAMDIGLGEDTVEEDIILEASMEDIAKVGTIVLKRWKTFIYRTVFRIESNKAFTNASLR